MKSPLFSDFPKFPFGAVFKEFAGKRPIVLAQSGRKFVIPLPSPVRREMQPELDVLFLEFVIGGVKSLEKR
jgi:hypothetical protein